MKLRFYNARYLDSNDMTVKKGTVCTNGERFSYVGSTENAPENEVYDRDIDLKKRPYYPRLLQRSHPLAHGFPALLCGGSSAGQMAE